MTAIPATPASHRAESDDARRVSAPATHAAAGYAMRYPPVGPRKRNTPGAPSGVKTGNPAAPAARYTTILAAPAAGPNIMPARITSIGCNVIGTGVNGSGIDTCDAAATAAANPTIPTAVNRCRESDGVRVVISVHSRNAEGNRVTAAKAQRRKSTARIPIL